MRDFTLSDVAKGIQEQHPEISSIVLKEIVKKAFNKILRVMSKGDVQDAFCFKQCDITWVFNMNTRKVAIQHIFDLDETKLPNSYQEVQFRQNRKDEKKRIQLPVWYSSEAKEVSDKGYSGPGLHQIPHNEASDTPLSE